MIEKARELGLALASSAEYVRMIEARQNAANDDALNALMADFREKRDEVISLMQENDYDSERAVAASADLERIQQQLFENPLFSELLQAEETFQQLVAAVNQEITACISAADPTEGSCNGNCSGCSGCSH